ncbi:efflux RND transporter periplasmic adaptor subunit [Pollutibacter soli]|uniref:efflux RND transporter periplasmic adaptor subunit n=1 Tax=Pollutibacter soli TaxID=3034157 RepID=UPI0030136857
MNRFLILYAAFVIAGCSDEKYKEEQHQSFAMSEKMMSTTETVPARKEQLRNALSFYGRITADNNKMIEVYPVVGGNVTKVFVELGDYVQRGQLLATIRSTEVAGYEKELDDARNDVVVSSKNLKVAEELFDGKLNTERDVLEAQSNLKKAESQLKRINQTYSIYNIRPGATYEVRSPLNGYIIQKNINEAMLLRNDRSDNIFDIAEINDVWVLANINESDIHLIKLGIDAEVTTLSYPDKVFYGKVDKIFNIINPETKAMQVRIKLTNENNMLKPEMRANIRLTYSENKEMIAIPSSAIIFDKSKNFVMVFRDRNNIETRQVEVFRQLGDRSYITSGLAADELVMTTNQLLIYDALND